MTVLSLDVESRSAVDIKKAGAYRYWEDSSTSLWCACYAFDDEPVETWLPGEPCPPRVAEHVAKGGTVAAWNAAFERLAWRHALAPRHGWPMPALEQFDDTAAWGAAMGLPRALGDAAKAMGLPEEKDDEGRRLMLQMAKPRQPKAKGAPPHRPWVENEAGEFRWRGMPGSNDVREAAMLPRLVEYCIKDVEAERALRRVLLPLSPEEREVYLMDQRMNDRGVAIDVTLVRALLQIVNQAKADLDRKMALATNYAVKSCSAVAQIKAWLNAREAGWTVWGQMALDECDRTDPLVSSLAKAKLAKLLKGDEISEQGKAVLRIRQEAAKSSTAKLNAMLACVCEDGRARGMHLYHGAGTGRWSGRLIQTQNMPGGTGTVKDPEAAVEDFL